MFVLIQCSCPDGADLDFALVELTRTKAATFLHMRNALAALKESAAAFQIKAWFPVRFFDTITVDDLELLTDTYSGLTEADVARINACETVPADATHVCIAEDGVFFAGYSKFANNRTESFQLSWNDIVAVANTGGFVD